MYATLFLFCFGSSSNVLRGLGENRFSRFSTPTRSMFKKSTVHDHTALKGWKPISTALEDCGEDGSLSCDSDYTLSRDCNNGYLFKDNYECGCWVKNVRFPRDSDSETKRFIYNMTDVVDYSVDHSINAQLCRDKCVMEKFYDVDDLDGVAYECKWWVWRIHDNHCIVKDRLPTQFKNTTDLRIVNAEGVSVLDERWAGPPCGPPKN